MTDKNWIIRPAQGDDLPFIYSTWAKSFRYGSNFGKSCRNSVFYPQFNRVIDLILDDSSTITVVACLPEEPEVILSYLVYQPDVIQYAFTKFAFRNLGISRSLLESLGTAKFFTHLTYRSDQISQTHPDVTYNPFINFRQKQGGHDG